LAEIYLDAGRPLKAAQVWGSLLKRRPQDPRPYQELGRALEEAGDYARARQVYLAGRERTAAAYFGCFPHLLRVPDMPFPARSRRPPKDPVNVLLSLGYTLLANALHTQVMVAGLDPYLGCLHAPDYGRPSLVLDLMEEFRPVLVDTLVLQLVNNRIIQPRDFFYPQDREPAAFDFAETEPAREGYPILLGHTGLKKFVTYFERRLNHKVFYLPRGERLTYRGVLLAQVRAFIRTLEEDAPYQPFKLR